MRRISALIGIVALATLVSAREQAPGAATGRLLHGGAGGGLDQALTAVDAMLADGRLDIGRIHDDTVLPGRQHERLVQLHEGVPVFGGQVVRQMDGGRVVSVIGRLHEGLAVATDPLISSAGAARLAAAALAPGASPWGEPVLGILPSARGAALTYRVRVASDDDIQMVFVNARTGAIERQYSDLQSQATVGRGTGVFGDNKKVSVNSAAGTFQSDDRLRPAVARTLDFRGSLSRLNSFLASGFVSNADVATDSDNVWTDGATVDAHAYTGWVYDYYFKRFGRRGLNDANMTVNAIVHPLRRQDASLYSSSTQNRFINNALYLGFGFTMYGDGDGALFDFFAAALDVVAHELTHGVTDFTSGLVYQDEPGALNEAISDIFGAAVEFFYEPAGTGRQRADWLLGEDVTRFAPGYLRSMQNPVLRGHPDHYSLRFTGPEDNGGVHINSSIINHAFYLAVAGGTNRVSGVAVQGIGQANLERMERIFYRAFMFTLGSDSRFIDARAATLQSAADLFGASSNEHTQLVRAWNAVGVQ